MSANKRPRKAYKPKPCVLPLGLRNNAAFEMPGWQAGIALGAGYLHSAAAIEMKYKMKVMIMA